LKSLPQGKPATVHNKVIQGTPFTPSPDYVFDLFKDCFHKHLDHKQGNKKTPPQNIIMTVLIAKGSNIKKK
jgi:hypothetical protein